jgi:hydroxymethylglutaryl-CoA lyase
MQEVGTRDGLQDEAVFVPTEDKIALVDALSDAGLAKIEVTAFVSPQAIPALRDAEIGAARDRAASGRGLHRARAQRARRRARDRSRARRAQPRHVGQRDAQPGQPAHDARAVVRGARAGGGARARPAWRERVAVVRFGCPMEGDVPDATVLDWCARFVDELGARGVTLCDTTGMAYPGQVARSPRRSASAGRERPHAALPQHARHGPRQRARRHRRGADRFDASLGGIGGCPYAPGATGNVCSEEIVHALELMGYDTGVDLERLVAAARRLPDLIGHDVPSQIVKAGRRLDLHPVPADFDTIRERAPRAPPTLLHPRMTTAMTFFRRALALALVLGAARGARPDLSRQARHADRAHRTRRHHRHRGAHAGRPAGPAWARPSSSTTAAARAAASPRWRSSAPRRTATRCSCSTRAITSSRRP